jgi:hypothetical protein
MQGLECEEYLRMIYNSHHEERDEYVRRVLAGQFEALMNDKFIYLIFSLGFQLTGS